MAGVLGPRHSCCKSCLSGGSLATYTALSEGVAMVLHVYHHCLHLCAPTSPLNSAAIQALSEPVCISNTRMVLFHPVEHGREVERGCPSKHAPSCQTASVRLSAAHPSQTVISTGSRAELVAVTEQAEPLFLGHPSHRVQHPDLAGIRECTPMSSQLFTVPPLRGGVTAFIGCPLPLKSLEPKP